MKKAVCVFVVNKHQSHFQIPCLCSGVLPGLIYLSLLRKMPLSCCCCCCCCCCGLRPLCYLDKFFLQQELPGLNSKEAMSTSGYYTTTSTRQPQYSTQGSRHALQWPTATLKMLNIINNRENANQNNKEMSPNTCQSGQNQEDK